MSRMTVHQIRLILQAYVRYFAYKVCENNNEKPRCFSELYCKAPVFSRVGPGYPRVTVAHNSFERHGKFHAFV